MSPSTFENALTEFQATLKLLPTDDQRCFFLVSLGGLAVDLAPHKMGSKPRNQFLEKNFRRFCLECLGPEAPPRWYERLLPDFFFFRPSDEWRQQVDQLVRLLKSTRCEEFMFIRWRLVPTVFEAPGTWFHVSDEEYFKKCGFDVYP